MNITRFELLFDGDYQNIGIFQGAKDVGVELDMGVFDDQLAMPNYESMSVDRSIGYAASFFTEEGLKQFHGAIQMAMSAIHREENGWEVIEIKEEVKEKDSRVLYQDNHQVILFRLYQS